MTFVVYMCLLALNNVTYRKEPNPQKKEKTNKRQLNVTSNLATRKGMPDDVVPGPLPTMIIEVVPEPEPILPDNEFGREEDENVDVVNLSDNVENNVDEEAYRDLNHNLVGCKITAFYLDEGVGSKGVSLGTMRKGVNFVCVSCFEEDGSDDYISPNEINRVDVILCV